MSIKYNALKLILSYRKLDSRKFSLLLGNDYTSYKIGRLCSMLCNIFSGSDDGDDESFSDSDEMGACVVSARDSNDSGRDNNKDNDNDNKKKQSKKKNSDNKSKKKNNISGIELKRFSDVLGVSETLLFNEYDVDFDIDLLVRRLRCDISMNDLSERYYISVCVMCVCLLYRFLVERYRIRVLDVRGLLCLFKGGSCFGCDGDCGSGISGSGSGDIGNNVLFCVSDKDEVCDTSSSNNRDDDNDDNDGDVAIDIDREKVISVILDWLCIRGKCVSNIIGMLEDMGFIFFSFRGCGWCGLRSFSVLSGNVNYNGIIFLRDDLSELEIRESVLREVVRIVILLCFGSGIEVRDSVIDSIVSGLILQDCWRDKVCGIDLRCYSDVCRWMDALRMSGISFVRRLSEFGIDCGNYFVMKKVGLDLDKFYNGVWSVSSGCFVGNNNKSVVRCRDKVLLWEKVKELSYSYEYISNVTGLSVSMINEFCFGVDRELESSVESKLKIV